MLRRTRKVVPSFVRYFSSGGKNLIDKTYDASYDNDKSFWNSLKEEYRDMSKPQSERRLPEDVQVCIVGGGLIGMSVAFWLKHMYPTHGLDIAIIERDPTYTRASSMLSCGGLRNQFTVPENVQLSLFTAGFLQNIKTYLSILDGKEPPDVQFNHQGYLFLENEENAEKAVSVVKMQNDMGAKTKLFTKSELGSKFPWLNLENVAVGSYGMEGEGWFDPWLLLKYLHRKNASHGVRFIQGEMESFGISNEGRIKSANIKRKDGSDYSLQFNTVINCGGPWAGEIARMAGIGLGSGDLATMLPVNPKKRYVYVFHCPNGPGITMPFLVDTTGVYCRREGLGGHYICGGATAEEPPIDDLSVDYEFFEEALWPNLAYRVPKFEKLKLKSAWAGYYDYNDFDQNLIIGRHPTHTNFMFANGSSGHGLQHSIAIGRSIAELYFMDKFDTVDLSRFTFDRLFKGDKLDEINIV